MSVFIVGNVVMAASVLHPFYLTRLRASPGTTWIKDQLNARLSIDKRAALFGLKLHCFDTVCTTDPASQPSLIASLEKEQDLM